MSKLIFLLFGSILFSQTGETIYQFMNIPTSSRQAALGGNVNAIYDKDPSVSLWNPSLMNEEMHGQLGVNFTNYLADIKQGNLSYVHQLNEENFVSIHGRYVDYGSFVQADNAGNITGDFSAKDAAISLGFAHKLNDFFTIGIQSTYVNSTIESYQSSAILNDVAVTFHDYDYYNTVALVIRNFGFIIEPYDEIEEDLPFQINLGYNFRPANAPVEISVNLHDLQNWNLSNPVNPENNQETGFGRELIDHLAVGAELFPGRGFNLRFGYNFRRGNELAVQDARSLAGLSFGFGLRIGNFTFDYAHARYHNSTNVNSFGLRIDIPSLLNRR